MNFNSHASQGITENTSFDPSQPIDLWQLPPNISIETSDDILSGRKIKFTRNNSQIPALNIIFIIYNICTLAMCAIVCLYIFKFTTADNQNNYIAWFMLLFAVGPIILANFLFKSILIKKLKQDIYIELTPAELILKTGSQDNEKITHTFPRTPEHTIALTKDIINNQQSSYHYYILLSHDGLEFLCWKAQDQNQANSYVQFLNALIQSQLC